MTRYAFIYGSLAGLAITFAILTGLTLAQRDGFFTSEYFGYLTMLVALSLIFIGVKRYRDVEMGGVVRFLQALKAGLAIALVAAAIYVLVWEIYLAATGYRFMDEYLAGMARDLREQGKSAADVAREMASWDGMRESYRNPLFRVPVTFLEIFPVGLLVALVSAALLRNPKLLPARAG